MHLLLTWKCFVNVYYWLWHGNQQFLLFNRVAWLKRIPKLYFMSRKQTDLSNKGEETLVSGVHENQLIFGLWIRAVVRIEPEHQFSFWIVYNKPISWKKKNTEVLWTVRWVSSWKQNVIQLRKREISSYIDNKTDKGKRKRNWRKAGGGSRFKFVVWSCCHAPTRKGGRHVATAARPQVGPGFPGSIQGLARPKVMFTH